MSFIRSLGRGSVLLLVIFGALGAGCARNEQMMAASGETPAAQGTVSTESGDNGNTVVHVRVKHLAPASRVAPGATTYVVWLQVLGDSVHAVGALNVNDDLEGELDFVTPHRVFRVVVTPEIQATVVAPSHPAVFTADVDTH
jgi:hypothetical protein